jgi:nucleoside recognition membrane protein YjiH
VMVRIWPVTGVPDVPTVSAPPEAEAGAWSLSTAWQIAVQRAAAAPPMGRVAREGMVDGFVLAASILGTILAVGTGSLLIVEHTDLFVLLGRPLVPALTFLGLEDAAILGPAIVAGITEMYIPALMSVEAGGAGRFFICVLSISQLVFFSSVGPMMMDMFADLPVRLRDLVGIFILRTAILVPLLAGLTALLDRAGLFAGLG